ncbi:Hypothetical predicted protein [Olea europaea subsp. europaea]|uniref:Uncharacterized protein n=1 Tax=Olea europaea subsp. europaea TaxID=158383 RepID=A0A8S0SA41_OLEEU|nr:Hypothetical predicted protein [Olea europaea subsp. europaea]
MSKSCPGRVLTAARMLPNFQAFLGSFWDTVCRPCPGPTGTQPNFQAFLGNFWDTVCRPHLGRVLVMAGTQHRIVAVAGTQVNSQALSGTRCAGHVRDASTFSGISMQFLGQARSQAFWAVTGVQCVGHVRDTSGLRTQLDFQAMSRTWRGRSPIFRHFYAVSGTRCAGYIRDASWPWQGRRLIFRHTKAEWYAGHVRDAGTRRHIFMHMKAAWDAGT